MSVVLLKELSTSDGCDIYNMLQSIGKEENEFHNDVNGMSYDKFKQWLVIQYNWAHGKDLPKGYVKQWTFWLYVDGAPVGYGKLREKLTAASRSIGGNIGYAISSHERGKGYGSILFQKLLEKAKELKIETIMSTVEKNNPSSKRVQEKCGGVLIEENDERWFYRFFKYSPNN